MSAKDSAGEETRTVEAAPASWWLYLVRCADRSLYTGIAVDVDRRFAEHSNDNSARGAKYLRGRGPLELVFRSEVGTRSEAQRLEAKIKRLSRAEKEQLIIDPTLLRPLLETEESTCKS